MSYRSVLHAPWTNHIFLLQGEVLKVHRTDQTRIFKALRISVKAFATFLPPQELLMLKQLVNISRKVQLLFLLQHYQLLQQATGNVQKFIICITTVSVSKLKVSGHVEKVMRNIKILVYALDIWHKILGNEKFLNLQNSKYSLYFHSLCHQNC